MKHGVVAVVLVITKQITLRCTSRSGCQIIRLLHNVDNNIPLCSEYECASSDNLEDCREDESSLHIAAHMHCLNSVPMFNQYATIHRNCSVHLQTCI